MFDIGWSEMLVIGVVALVVLGPKELPGALRTFAYWTKQARKLAREFQSGVDDMIRQSELAEAKKAVEDAKRTFNREIENSIDPTGELKKSVTDTQQTIKSSLAATPASPAKAADPAAAYIAATTPSAAPAAPATAPAAPTTPAEPETKSAASNG
jgi:sec-independent protein translocase protein TatB